jgi:hypothetical protein
VLAPPTAFEAVTGLTLFAPIWFQARDDEGQPQVWALPANGRPAFQYSSAPGGVSEWAGTTGTNARDLAFIADGSIWIQRLNSQAFRLQPFDSVAPATLAIRPDGAQLAFVNETATASGLYVMATDGSEARRIVANIDDPSDPDAVRIYRRPQYSPDGTRLLVDVYAGDATVSSAIVEIETGTVVPLPTESVADARALTARWLRDGRVLTYSDAVLPSGLDAGLYVFDSVSPDTTPAEWIPLPADAIVRDVVLTDDNTFRVLLADQATPRQALVVDVSGLQQTTILPLPALDAPRLSSDGRFVFGYEQLQAQNGVLSGALVVVDLNSGAAFRLIEPAAVSSARWG